MIFHKGMGFGFLLLLEWALGLGLVCAGEVRCVEREREALLRFKKGLVDDFGVLSSWGSEECCEWKGVVCSNTSSAHVIALLLGFYDFDYSYFQPLRGNISDALLELHHLTNLDLSNNYFDQLFPEFICSMKQLEHLNLQDSLFIGTLPPQLGNLTNLQTLDLSFNHFLMPNDLNWLSHLSLLTRLDLSYIDLSHTNWLKPILKLRSLQELILQYSSIISVAPFANISSISLSTLNLGRNMLTSSTLDWLFNISSNLTKIVMWQNELDGPIPKVFGRFSFLRYLDLSGNRLEGEISKSLGNLSHLQTLILSENYFRGDLEKLLGNQSTKMTMSLETLDLSYNQLIGSLSLLDLKAFPSLRYLGLGRNNLTGSMPEDFSQHSVLEGLDVSYNPLEGIISETGFSKLHNLMVLDLSFNSLTLQISQDWIPPFQLSEIKLAGCNMSPHFPKWLHTQKKVRFLDLSYAGIADEVPNWLWSFSPLLQNLNLSYNQISGVIPDLSSSSITKIDVSSNKFSGPIPLFQQNISTAQFSQNMFFGSFSSICMIMHARFLILDLSNNQLSGEIPNCWEKMSALYFLNLADNKFFGVIPHTLGSLMGLWSLNLSGNNLFGILPSNLRNCERMMFIDVGGNKLRGNIPAWIGANVNLMYLILSRNNFYGSIPQEICNLTYVRVLDISRNHISGEIPQCFYNFTSMVEEKSSIDSFSPYSYMTQFYEPLQQFEYTFVQWKGGEFEYRKNLKHLKLIDLSSNRLMESIPISFSRMKGLVSLNLSRNLLTGALIPNIGQMRMLEVLDLSRNQLSGDIPISLAQLHFLAVLDLANNNFSGRIPMSTQLQSFNESAYAGNDELCGLPLKLCPEDIPSPTNTDEGDSIKKDGGIMRLSFMHEVGISMALGFIVGFWGVVGSMVVKRSWRVAYFKLLDEAEDWFYNATLKRFRS